LQHIFFSSQGLTPEEEADACKVKGAGVYLDSLSSSCSLSDYFGAFSLSIYFSS